MPKSEGEFAAVFARLRAILARHAGALEVISDTPARYCLDAPIGPATLEAWAGKARRLTIPVAWVESGKAYVSYHLMGVSVPSVQAGVSSGLKARMQGKTCFNFVAIDDTLADELDGLTARSIAAFRTSGFIL